MLQLLAKEQEVDEKSHHLKAAMAEVDSLKAEVSRLRRYEDELNNVQVSKDSRHGNVRSHEKYPCYSADHFCFYYLYARAVCALDLRSFTCSSLNNRFIGYALTLVARYGV